MINQNAAVEPPRIPEAFGLVSAGLEWTVAVSWALGLGSVAASLATRIDPARSAVAESSVGA